MVAPGVHTRGRMDGRRTKGRAGCTRRIDCRTQLVAGRKEYPKSVWYEDHEMREEARIFLDEFLVRRNDTRRHRADCRRTRGSRHRSHARHLSRLRDRTCTSLCTRPRVSQTSEISCAFATTCHQKTGRTMSGKRVSSPVSFLPPDALRETLERALERARNAGIGKIDLANDALRDYVAEWIGRRLEVSASVVLRRGSDDGLWRR